MPGTKMATLLYDAIMENGGAAAGYKGLITVLDKINKVG